MKYVLLFIVSLWSIWGLYFKFNLKPSDDIILWSLLIISITASIIGNLIFIIEKK